MGRFVGSLRDRERWVRLVRQAWFGRRGELASLCSEAGPGLDRGPGAPCDRDNPQAPLCSEAGPDLDRGPGAPCDRDNPHTPLCSEAGPGLGSRPRCPATATIRNVRRSLIIVASLGARVRLRPTRTRGRRAAPAIATPGDLVGSIPTILASPGAPGPARGARLPRPGRTGPPATLGRPRPPWHRRVNRSGPPPRGPGQGSFAAGLTSVPD